MKRQMKGTLALVLGTVIWGSAFIAQSVGMDHIEPFTFQTVRCALAVLFLFPCSWIFEKEKGKFWEKWRSKQLWKVGSICGFALFVAAGLQQVGLVFTAAGKAGFLTAMYIVLVPILGLVLGKRPPFTAWLSVGIAVMGLYLLSFLDTGNVNLGDILLLGCALAFAVQILLIDNLTGSLDGIRLNCVQSLFCTLCSGLLMICSETPKLENILACWLPLSYAGILSMGVAYTLQIVGQKNLEPTRVSLIMSLESVFAAVFGWLLLNESMTISELLGCMLVFGAVVLSQVPVKSRK